MWSFIYAGWVSAICHRDSFWGCSSCPFLVSASWIFCLSIVPFPLIYLHISLSTWIFTYNSACLWLFLSMSSSLYLYIYLPMYISIYSVFYVTLYTFISANFFCLLLTYFSIHLSIFLIGVYIAYLFIYLSRFLSLFVPAIFIDLHP